jgi:hypothetical protein
MSRSRKKPFSYVCSSKGKHSDKTVAARCYRRLESSRLRSAIVEGDFEDYLHPVRREASYNDPWSWGVDGGAGPVETPPSAFALAQAGLGDMSWIEDDQEYYERVQRK